MKTKFFLLTMLTCGAVLLHSCDNDDDYEMGDQEFVTSASSSNNLEIMAGELAISKGANANVKAYGAHMKTDHTAAGLELTALAGKKGLTISTTLQSRHQDQLNLLSPLTGAAFDKAFAEMMVNSHQEAVSLFRQASQHDGVPDAELRAWAEAKLPTLEHHLQEAIALRTQLQ